MIFHVALVLDQLLEVHAQNICHSFQTQICRPVFVVVVKIQVHLLQIICICNVILSHTLYQCLATGMMQSLQNLTRLGVVGCVGNIENQQSHMVLVQEFVRMEGRLTHGICKCTLLSHAHFSMYVAYCKRIGTSLCSNSICLKEFHSISGYVL